MFGVPVFFIDWCCTVKAISKLVQATALTLPLSFAWGCQLHEIWEASGGQIELLIDHSMVAKSGVELNLTGDSVLSRTTSIDEQHVYALAGRSVYPFMIKMDGLGLEYVVSGRLAVDIEVELLMDGHAETISGLELIYRSAPLGFDLVDRRGLVWFRVDEVVPQLLNDGRLLAISEATVRPGGALMLTIPGRFGPDWDIGRLDLKIPIVHSPTLLTSE
jgi:hypothetical protein